MIIYRYALYGLELFSLVCPFAVIGMIFQKDYWSGCLWLALIVFLSPGIRFIFDGNSDEELPAKSGKLIIRGACLSAVVLVASLIAPNLLAITLLSLFLGIGALTHSKMQV